VLHDVRVDVPLQVVDADERHAATEGDRLRRGDPHQERPDEPRPDGDGHGVDVSERRLGLAQRHLEQRVDALEVRPGGDLGDHAPELLVEVSLAGDQVRTDQPPVLDDRDGRLVA
jgi:hypothetical protein